MPTPNADIGHPTAWADGETVRVKFPVRCETGQREAEMNTDEARRFANAVMIACNNAEREAWIKSAEEKR